jgi:hypothetical protein
MRCVLFVCRSYLSGAFVAGGSSHHRDILLGPWNFFGRCGWFKARVTYVGADYSCGRVEPGARGCGYAGFAAVGAGVRGGLAGWGGGFGRFFG